MLYHITNDQHGAAVAGSSWLPGSRRRYENFSTSALPSEPELARILDILDTQKYIFSTSAPLSLLCVEFEIDISILQISLLCHLGVIDNLAACKVSVHYHYFYLFQCGMEMEICSEVAMIIPELTLTYIQRQRQQLSRSRSS